MAVNGGGTPLEIGRNTMKKISVLTSALTAALAVSSTCGVLAAPAKSAQSPVLKAVTKAAVKPAPPVPIPVMPGLEPELQMVFGHDDLLPFIIQCLNSLEDQTGGAQAASAAHKQLCAKTTHCFDKVTGLAWAQFRLFDTNGPSEKIMSFYTSPALVMGKRKIISYHKDDGEVAELWCGPGGSGLYAIWIQPLQVLRVVRMDGSIDLSALLTHFRVNLNNNEGHTQFSVGMGTSSGSKKTTGSKPAGEQPGKK